MRGPGKALSRHLYLGYKAHMQVFDEVEDVMVAGNNVVPRAHIKTEVVCAVIWQDQILHFETRMDFNAATYATQAYKKFGRCRVVFYQANEAQMWREIRWKNANVGTLYRRPSFLNLCKADVPEQLQLAAMLI